MTTVLLATPFLANHVDAGWFWLAALGRQGVATIAWDYRREPQAAHSADLMLAMKTPPYPDRFHGYTAAYWPDELGRDPESEAWLPQYERVYTCLRPTPPGMTWLPTAYDPHVHYPRNAPKERDMVFIGTATDRKRDFLKEMAKAAPLTLFGNGWKDSGPVYLEDYCVALSSAKIAINIHRGEVGLNRRVFEAMACTFTLTDRVAGIAELLGPSLAAKVSFSTPKHGRELAERYINDEPARRELWAMEREAIRGFTYDAAVQRVLSDYLKAQGPVEA